MIPLEDPKDIQCSGTGVTDGCELSYGNREPNFSSVQEQVFLTTEGCSCLAPTLSPSTGATDACYGRDAQNHSLSQVIFRTPSPWCRSPGKSTTHIPCLCCVQQAGHAVGLPPRRGEEQRAQDRAQCPLRTAERQPRAPSP